MNTPAPVAALQALLERGQDSALLRFSLGNAWLKADRPEQAIAEFRQAVRQDPQYSAAWKLLGKTLAGIGQNDAAIAAYEQGIGVAESRGDLQAAKEMQVFLRRLQRQSSAADDGA